MTTTESSVDSSSHVSGSQSEDGRHPDEQSNDPPTTLTLKTKTSVMDAQNVVSFKTSGRRVWIILKNAVLSCSTKRKACSSDVCSQHKTCIVPRQDMTATAQPLREHQTLL